MYQEKPQEGALTVEQFTAKIIEAVKGENAAVEVQSAVTRLLKSYGIETPIKK